MAGCGPPRPPLQTQPHSERVDNALARATEFLIERQAADGAWRSDVYGSFKEGDALTPLVLDALSPPDAAAAVPKGLEYLTKLTRSGKPPAELNYPVYTAALAVTVLSRSKSAEHRHSRDIWLAFLRRRQLIEPLGWQPEDVAYGGWGFGESPQRPSGDGAIAPFAQANISTTVFAVEALRSAGVPPEDPALRAAIVFLQRCQNHGKTDQGGGFFFSREDVVRNKAGANGECYSSYGSATADGFRGLLACGLRPDDRRVAAARQWLERNFSATSHPGQYAADREPLREAVYFYWCRSLALALLEMEPRKTEWAAALADALLERQRSDGSWSNPLVAQREDDPLVSTAFALKALRICSKNNR